MVESINEVVELMDLEQIENNLLRSNKNIDIGSPNLFGGQVLGQALVAAARTVEAGRLPHSLHGYFLRPGDKKSPIIYVVDRIRDGGSFTTRRVVAIQKGEPIFNLAASFQIPEESVDHQVGTSPVASVPAPETLVSETEIRSALAEKYPQLKARLLERRPLEIRPVTPIDFVNPDPTPPVLAVWVRSHNELPDDPVLHRALLAYVSDFFMVPTAMRPHGLSFMRRDFMGVSLDHAMWFHRDFRIDDWLLCMNESPTASQARGLTQGRIYTRDGQLVASVIQEGLLRLIKPAKNE